MLCFEDIMRRTSEDEFDGEEVGANGQRHHGEGKAHELPDDRATLCISACVVQLI